MSNAAASAVMAGAEPFAHGGGRVGVLLSHGYTGTPQSMRPWAEHLAAAGYTVRVPRLPGHGTRWQDLNRTEWPDWYATIDNAFRDLGQQCDQVFVGGLSMGGLLAARLAEEHGDAVAGLMLVNAIFTHDDPRLRLLPVLSKFVPSFPGIASDIAKPGAVEQAYDRNPLRAMASQTRLWKIVDEDLARITQPVIFFHSRVDHVVPTHNVTHFLAGISSTDTTSVELPDSFHVATLDNDAPTIFSQSQTFIERLSRTER